MKYETSNRYWPPNLSSLAQLSAINKSDIKSSNEHVANNSSSIVSSSSPVTSTSPDTPKRSFDKRSAKNSITNSEATHTTDAHSSPHIDYQQFYNHLAYLNQSTPNGIKSQPSRSNSKSIALFEDIFSYNFFIQKALE